MTSPINHSLGSVELARGNAVPKTILNVLRENPNAEAFWSTTYRDSDIDELRWDQSFPFQLMILEEVGGRYVELPGGNSRFTLPIPPQSMTKSMPFAIGLTVTQGGVVEEHNGIPVRTISLQGTTGVLPGRGAGTSLAKPNFLESVFAGTIRSAQGVANAALKLDPNNGFRVNYIKNDDVLGELKGTTGYLQFLLLSQFLEAYAHVKKTKAGRKYRLAFAHWKTGEVYLVTPINLDVTQNVSSPLEYTFNFSMKAWKRIDLGWGAAPLEPTTPSVRDPGAMQQVLSKLTAARAVIERSKDVISSAGQDVFSLCIEPLRQTGLFIKDALGVALVAADLPNNIIQSMKGAIIEVTSLGDLTSALQGVPEELVRSLAELGSISSKNEVAAGFHGAVPAESGGMPESKPQPPGPAGTGAPHPMNKILENPGDNYDFFSKLSPGRLNLRPATVAAMVKERERVREFQRIDFEQMRDGLASLQADFCDAVGLGNATYNRVMGRATPTSTRAPTDADYEVMYTLNAAIAEMNKLAVSGKVGDQNRIDVIDYIAGLAGRSGINFTIPASKFQVPFPYKNTLEQLATRYLGDPDRWMEIATLNRLRPPYVDEEGFDLSLLVNGNGNQVLVSTAENLFVGQPVWLKSNNQNKDKRRITAIDPVSTGVVRVVVDGNPDLAKFTVSAQSTLHAFLPDTVNSMMLISIPSSSPAVEEDFQGKSIPGIDQFKNLLQAGGITLALDGTGDAAITPDGSWRYAVGMDALVQRVRIWASTVQGTLKRHPAFGIPIEVGASTADVSAKDLLDSLQTLSQFDRAFAGVENASVVKNGPTAQMHATFKIAGTSQLLPITIDVSQ